MNPQRDEREIVVERLEKRDTYRIIWRSPDFRLRITREN